MPRKQSDPMKHWGGRGRGRGGGQRPPGLRGKEIGMYYRDLGRQKKLENQENQAWMSLKVPLSVVKRVRTLLHSIASTQRTENVFIKPEPKTFEPSTINSQPLFQASTGSVQTPVVKMEAGIQEVINNDPGPSNAKTSFTYDSKDIVLPLRPHYAQYKYGYQDIITGTFMEKLDECLAKGSTINIINEEVDNLNEAYRIEYEDMIVKNEYKRMLKFRERLPAFKKSNDLLKTIDNNQVVVISGETGCGKSTQVPQMILDNAIKQRRGANIKILVTQPRRIAASSLAQRVAEERAERMGNSVGYVVRLEKVEARPRASIMFCTTGVLLADIELNQGLTDVSHVILDEVHERDTNVDLAMCMLKQVITKRKDLKLILMSATLDAERLSSYFNDCQTLHIEGLAYPVKDIYLEEILKTTGFTLPPTQSQDKRGPKRYGNQFKSRDIMKDMAYRSEIDPWLSTKRNELDRSVFQTISDSRIEELNPQLILELLTHICRGEPGAVLVFLPGFTNITSLLRLMNESGCFPSSQYDIYPLHSKLPSAEQRRIFDKPPAGKRKIIVATNIAETSITIDDVVYVVDCAKIKVNGLNVKDNISTLGIEWVSQANLRQRRGRAGRVQPGICYHLLTTYRASKLDDRLLPELQRTNLLEAVLSIKRLRLGKAAEALSMVPDPPALETVTWAVKHLKQIGALDGEEQLTPLGWHLARLPVHPNAGKLLVLGALFGCLDRAASVAAVWGFKDPFMLVIGKERDADAAKFHLALGEPSDHIAMSEALLQWERQGSRRGQFAYDNFLSSNTLQLLSEMKNQFGGNLKDMGFLATSDVRSGWENRNAKDLSLFKAIVAASLYPNIAKVRWMGRNNPHKPQRIIARTPEDGRVHLHPSSIMATPPGRCGKLRLCDNPGADWLVYWLKQKSSQLFLFDVTLVYTLPLLFFGELQVTDVEDSKTDCFIAISSVKVRCEKETANLLIELRSLLDQVLASKVAKPGEKSTHDSDFEEKVLNAVIELIGTEDVQAEYVGDDEDDMGSDYSEADVPIKPERYF